MSEPAVTCQCGWQNADSGDRLLRAYVHTAEHVSIHTTICIEAAACTYWCDEAGCGLGADYVPEDVSVVPWTNLYIGLVV